MKKIFLSFLILYSSSFANPNFTVGSNPFYTFFGFPHDILGWPNKAVFTYFYPQVLPWQGNVTNISERPNDTYISNYNNFDFPVPDEYTGDPKAIKSYMRASGYAYQNRYSFGGIWNFGTWGKVYLELGTTQIDMEEKVDGIVRNNTTLELIPVAARTDAGRSLYDVQFVYASYLFGNPFGVRIQYQTKNTTAPDAQIRFVRNGTEIVSNHLTWGWTTTPCAHIFETSSQNFDAWFLNDYTLYKGGQLDLQASYEYKNHKSGIRYRRNREHGQTYYWQSSAAETDPYANFMGGYSTDLRYEDEIANDLIRAYDKVKFWQIGDANLGLLFFLQYADRDNNTVSTNEDANSEPLSSDSENEYTIEVNPWVNYKFGKSYFDFGWLFEFSLTGMENTAPRWNGSMGATEKGVVRASYPYEDGFSPSWEDFSQGSNNYFATGFEASTSVNIAGRFSALGSVLMLRKYSFIKKEYGDSEVPEGGGEYIFNPTHIRHDYKNETWMTGSVGLSYGWGPVQLLASMQLPLAYLLEKNTLLEGSGTTLVDLTQRNVWAVQEPVSFRFLLVFGLERP
ncbi:MAG TPA: hypothetical protein VMT35_20020 [Ignavibacteriaceae bacterium]|nr:hypothetical protein [Ignavibacteriaceae bacterium]